MPQNSKCPLKVVRRLGGEKKLLSPTSKKRVFLRGENSFKQQCKLTSAIPARHPLHMEANSHLPPPPETILNILVEPCPRHSTTRVGFFLFFGPHKQTAFFGPQSYKKDVLGSREFPLKKGVKTDPEKNFPAFGRNTRMHRG